MSDIQRCSYCGHVYDANEEVHPACTTPPSRPPFPKPIYYHEIQDSLDGFLESYISDSPDKEAAAAVVTKFISEAEAIHLAREARAEAFKEAANLVGTQRTQIEVHAGFGDALLELFKRKQKEFKNGK